MENVKQNQILKTSNEEDVFFKTPYFVFLDIDGTLWDAKYEYIYHSYMLNYVDYPKLNPNSIKAVNILLRSLDQKYDTRLVITSQRRKHLRNAIEYLSKEGLKYPGPVFAIKYPTNLSRGEEIINFMEKGYKLNPSDVSHLQGRIARFFYRMTNNDFNNYVVLEDERDLINKTIPRNRIIYADHDKRSITPRQIQHYLKKIGVPVLNAPEEELTNI